MNHWFRLYENVIDDPKVQRLPSKLFKAWINILCLASKNNGVIRYRNDIAFALRITDAKAGAIINSLSAFGLLDHTDGIGFIPHNWAGRQFKNDVSTERVKRFRKRQRNASGNGCATTPETAPDSDSDSEPEKKEKKKEKWPPSAGTTDLEFSKEGSPEDQFWQLLPALANKGIRRSLCVKLAKLNGGEFDVTLAQLRDAATKSQPATYLAAIVRRRDEECERERAHEQAPVAATEDLNSGEPAFVREYRADGYPVERRPDGAWKIGRETFDQNGSLIGW